MHQSVNQCFDDLTDHNWRNTFYIRCDGCRFPRRDGCGDFLFVPDEEGRPVLLPIRYAEAVYGLIDMGDCLGQMSALMFCELYKRWVQNALSDEGCPLLWIAEQRRTRP